MGDKFENISNSTINSRNIGNFESKNKYRSKIENEDTSALKLYFKGMIAEDKVDECISELSTYFESNRYQRGINSMVEISIKNRRITLDRSLEKISEEVFGVSSAKLRNALLYVIDNEIRYTP